MMIGPGSLRSIALQVLLVAAVMECQASLTFHSFDNNNNMPPTCADGSPFGIYVEDNPAISLQQSRKHILVFQGGGACANPTDCAKDYHEHPIVFSTHYNPATLQGNTILSNDPSINPSMHDYSKWLIPYCSQDFFLGSSTNNGRDEGGNFTHAGSIHFRYAISYWRDQVIQTRTNGSLDDVVVVGISAGAIGIMNHIPLIRAAARNLGTSHLRFILDAPTVVSDSSYVGKDFKQAIHYYNVNIKPNEDGFPFCDPSHPFLGVYDAVSVLPCCLSTHCLLRHDDQGLASFVLDDYNSTSTKAKETLLIVDSAYDIVAALGGTTLLQTDISDHDADSQFFWPTSSTATRDPVDATWKMMESAGSQKARARETAAAVKAMALQHQSMLVAQHNNNATSATPTTATYASENRLVWIMTSCACHTFIVPAVELLLLECQYSNYAFDGFQVVCSPEGHGVEYLSPLNIKIGLWKTIHTLHDVTFRGHSLEDIVHDFVMDNNHSRAPISIFGHDIGDSEEDNEVIELLFENCSGPNCLSKNEIGVAWQPSCQTMIVIENTFAPIPIAFQVLWLVFFAFVIVVSFVMRCNPKNNNGDDSTFPISKACPQREGKNAPEEQGARTPPETNLNICGIHVATNANTTILHGIDIALTSGAITGLLGRSGSGKSTLLKVLSQSSQPGLSISIEHGETQLQEMTKAYLCQEDPVLAFGNLCPSEYMLTTAEIYNAQPDKVQDLYDFTKELFNRGDEKAVKQEGKESKLNPFFETRIMHCSGGQRRILSIAATLLREPEVLLLDEPLSGLDTVSCLQVMSALASLAQLRNIAAIMTVHQPSTEILSYFCKIIVLDAGRVVVSERVNDPEKAAHLIEKRLLRSHENSSKFSLRQSSRRSLLLPLASDADQSIDVKLDVPALTRHLAVQPLQEASEVGSGFERPTQIRTNPELIEHIGSSPQEADYSSEEPGSKEGPKMFSSTGIVKHIFGHLLQVRPLAKRIQLQTGYSFMDGLTVIIALSVAAAMLLVDEGAHLQIVLASACMVAVPTFLFTHKIFAYNELWRSHKFEMDDKRISPVAFQMATALFTYPIPLMALIVAVAVAYAILRWSFATFVVQCLFAGVHLLIALQLGRVLCVAFHGDFDPVMKVYTTVLLINAVFSSLFVSSHKFPREAQFLFLLSINFWALSGAALNIFNDDNYNDGRTCVDLLSCVLSDGNVAGRTMGFAPLSSSYRALGILTAVFIALIGIECGLLYLRRDGFPRFFTPRRGREVPGVQAVDSK